MYNKRNICTISAEYPILVRALAELDNFDIKLLAALQADGRYSNQELAARVGLSPSQCSRRRQRLEKEGVITGYRAVIDREKAGFPLTVIVDVMLNTHNRDNAQRFAELVRRLPEIEEAYVLTGEMDYQLKVTVRGLRELSELINEQLLPDGSIQTVKSAIVLDTLKQSAGIALTRG